MASSPESQKKLPTFLKKLKETTKQTQEEINNSAANLNAVLETLTLISTIPVEANEENMAVSVKWLGGIFLAIFMKRVSISIENSIRITIILFFLPEKP